LILASMAHEAGHLMVSILLRVPVRFIAIGLGPTIWRQPLNRDMQLILRAVPTGMSIGVVGRWADDGRTLRPIRHDMLVALGGPIASFLFSALLVVLATVIPYSPAIQAWLTRMAAFSTVLGFLNLIPLPGLDGGHLLMLTATSLGLRLSPQQEIAIHRVGLQLTAIACIVVLAVHLVGRL